MHVNRASFCSIFGVLRHDFDALVAAGMPAGKEGAGRGGDWKIDTIQAHGWLVDRAVRAAGLDPAAGKVLDLSEERARLAAAQAVGHELRNAVTRGGLIPAVQVVGAWQAAIGRARSLLLSLPPAAAEELALVAPRGTAALRERLADMVHAALAELADADPIDDEEDAAPAVGNGGAG
jgi:phage terminase Nu1 subunit (DNA packaging protein)